VNSAVFLDRDGVINRKALSESDYITRWEEMEILPGVERAIALLNRAGFLVIVATNQRGVAKGLLTNAQLECIHQRMCEYLADMGARIHGIYYCPHGLDPPCNCRKPKAGMLLEAARVHNIDLASSWMIGDSEKDVEAGIRAGCNTAQVIANGNTGTGDATLVASSLLEVTASILQINQRLTRSNAHDNWRINS